MKQHGGGAIVNVGSMWAKQSIKATPSSAYSMAKAGLHSLTQHLAMELAEYGIRVNAVSPAVVVTPIYGEFIDPDKIEETLAGFNGFHPVGRVGRVDDVAAVVEFFALKCLSTSIFSTHKSGLIGSNAIKHIIKLGVVFLTFNLCRLLQILLHSRILQKKGNYEKN